MVRLVSPSGVEVLASDEVATNLVANGFVEAAEKAPAKAKPKAASKGKKKE